MSDPEAVMAAVDRFEAAQAELTSSTPVRPLEPDHTTADDQDDGSRVTGDCHAGSEGARRCDPSGPPDPESYLLPDEDDEE